MDEWRCKLAWEHFKFHAEQRTRMFHFFLITVGLLLNAFFLLRRDAPGETFAATVLLMAGGVFSTLFFALDVRNTQLLEYGEALLKKIEESLYPPSEWHEEQEGGGTIRLGMLAREAWLKRHTNRAASIRSKPVFRWIAFENAKHKLSIRLIVGLAMLLFWSSALTMAHGGVLPWEVPPPEAAVRGEEAEVVPEEETPGSEEETPNGGRQVPPWVVYLLCSWSVVWTIYAMARPGLDKKREQAAWDRFQPEPPAEAPAAGLSNPAPPPGPG